jgi:hypothetical protein
MAQFGEVSRELFPQLFNVSQIAGRLLIAWRSGESAEFRLQLEMARLWVVHSRPSSTLEMERLEALSGALESLHQKSRIRGAIGLLEQLAVRAVENSSAVNGWHPLPGKPAVVPCSQFVQ